MNEVSAHSSSGHSTHDRLKRIGFIATGARLLQLALRAVVVPISISLLGTNDYGYWLAVGSFATWFTVSDLGIGQLALSQLAERVGADDEAGARNILHLARRLYMSLAAIIAVLFAAGAASSISTRLIIGDRVVAHPGEIDKCFLIVGLCMTVAMAMNAAPLLNNVLLKTERIYIASTVAPLLGLLILALVNGVTHRISLVTYAWIMSLPSAIGAVCQFLFTFRTERRYRPKRQQGRSIALRGLLSSSTSLIVIQLADLAIYFAPSVLIARFWGPGYLTMYGVTASVFMIGVNLCFGWGQPHIAAYAVELQRRRFSWILTQHRSLLQKTGGFMLLVGLFLIALGPPLIRIYTANRVHISRDLVACMAIFYCLIVVSQQNGFLLLGLKMERTRAIIQALNATAMLGGVYLARQLNSFPALFICICITLCFDFIIAARGTRSRLHAAASAVPAQTW